jgi:hypothetical protein
MGSDYKLIFVGDATMSPYEILAVGGSVEYSNSEAGAVWINRMLDHFTHSAWLNPEPEGVWQYRQSISIIKDLMKSKMYPVNMQGLKKQCENYLKVIGYDSSLIEAKGNEMKNMINTSSPIYDRLRELKIELPKASSPAASYVMASHVGNIVYLSGHIAKKDGQVW